MTLRTATWYAPLRRPATGGPGDIKKENCFRRTGGFFCGKASCLETSSDSHNLCARLPTGGQGIRNAWRSSNQPASTSIYQYLHATAKAESPLRRQTGGQSMHKSLCGSHPPDASAAKHLAHNSGATAALCAPGRLTGGQSMHKSSCTVREISPQNMRVYARLPNESAQQARTEAAS